MNGTNGFDVSIDPLQTRIAPWKSAQQAAQAGRTDEAGKAFGTLLATLLVREMRRSVPEGLIGKGPGSDVYESWFDENVGRTLADSDALGLAGMIRTSIERKAQQQTEGAADAAKPAEEPR